MKSDEPYRLGNYEVHKAWEGFASIRQISSGEIMHSRTDPMEEARRLYVEQAGLAERAHQCAAEPLILWDVGLGAAANAMAAIECYENADAQRSLQVISFENDLDPLRLAAANLKLFPYLRAELIDAILAASEWRANDGKLIWKLLQGDFATTMNQAPAPDVIFYDVFSPNTSPQLWRTALFRELFGVCRNRVTELFTYTCSTANRAALFAAGFFVARGRRAGEKIETTIAMTPAAFHRDPAKRDLLGLDWLRRWERSAAKFPGDVAPNERSAFEKIIRDHEQFRNLPSTERLPSTT
ncbi:MAG TPA: MnmC family methyltransferase [Chthoniobacterales bacterium]|nr:MnmC family methyltransferase [Chthoniobacterales bacterium]